MKIKALIESLKAARPGYARALREMAEAGIMGPEAELPEPEEMGPEADEGGDHKQALKDALAALAAEAETLDEAELMKKFKAILKLIKGDTGGPDSGASDDYDTPAEESRKLRTKLALLEARDRVRAAADAAGVRVSEAVLAAVRPNITDAEARALVSELKGASGGQRARSATPAGNPVRESKAGAAEVPADGKAFARWISLN